MWPLDVLFIPFNNKTCKNILLIVCTLGIKASKNRPRTYSKPFIKMVKGKGKAKAKYYAVCKGHIPGIYRDWEEVEQQINGFPGAIYKSFKNAMLSSS